jgi:hypothetical protein
MMKSTRNEEWGMLLAPDGAEGGGGDLGGGESRGQAVFEEPSQGGQEGRGDLGSGSEGQGAGAGSQSPQMAPMVDAGALAERFGQVIGQHFQPPRREMTVEEAERLLNVWKPTKEWLAKYDNLESREQAIAEMRDGVIRHSDTITQYRLREMMQQMQQVYGPVVQHMQMEQAKAGEGRFKEAYPELGREEIRPLLFAVSQNLLGQGVQFRSEREMFQAIASGVEAVIKVSNPEFKLNGGGNGGTPMNAAKRKQGSAAAQGGIPVTTPGSGGGAGPKGPSVAKPRGLAIFDP